MAEDIRKVYMDGIDEADESEEELPADEISAEDDADEFAERLRRRKELRAKKKRRKRILEVVILIAVFATLITMCGRDIVRLKSENIALQRQQKELQEERDRLEKEVEKAGNREYVQDQARKQLRLLNPGELLFTFEDE